MADDEASGVYWHLSSLSDVPAVTASFPADEPDPSETERRGLNVTRSLTPTCIAWPLIR
jgi:hypothetical protein